MQVTEGDVWSQMGSDRECLCIILLFIQTSTSLPVETDRLTPASTVNWMQFFLCILRKTVLNLLATLWFLCKDVILKNKNTAEIIKSPTISAQWARCVWLWCRCCSSVDRLDAVWAESQLSHTSFQVFEQISGWTNGNSVVSERMEAKLLVGIKMKLFAHEIVMKCVRGEGEQFA